MSDRTGVTDRPSVGVVGVGSLGAAIAERLAAQGFAVTAHDLDPSIAEALAPVGIAWADTPRELAQRSDTILLLLPDTPDILQCLDGEDGLEVGLRDGAAVMIASTVDPESPQAIARRLAPRGVEVLDTPVSGGPVVARQGELVIMVGADEAGWERARPVLEAFGRPVHVGPVGHGEIAKLANNLIGAVIAIGTAEGMAFAAKSGADPDRVRQAIAGGSGSSWILTDWFPRTVLAGKPDADFAIRLMAKDTRLVEEFAERLGVNAPAARLARQIFTELRDSGVGERDFSYLAEVRAQEAGVHVEPQER
jgi:2-hydroxy-3-oxopropionate reductase